MLIFSLTFELYTEFIPVMNSGQFTCPSPSLSRKAKNLSANMPGSCAY